MLQQVRALRGYKLGALDGEIGHIREFDFEDENWTVGYLLADTGNWLTLLTRAFELNVHRQYNRAGYWFTSVPA